MSANKLSYERNERFGSGQANNTKGYGGSEYSPTNSDGLPHPFGGFATPPIGSGGFSSNGANATLSAVNPGPLYPSEPQLGVAYGYAVRREDGTYTRLIRADELDLYDIIPKSQGPEGLIILPTTRQLSPRRRAGPDPMISENVLRSLPPINGPRRKMPAALGQDATQLQIDSIVQRSALTTPVRPPRREKIYCDKWIHEGVCAFTQLGCKYLHEMPTDKATQVSLGLNHGIPTWYRRAHMADLRPLAPAPFAAPTTAGPAITNPTRLTGPWRRTGGSTSPTISSGARQSGSSFGPIGPPRQAPPRPSSSNPFAMLQSESYNGEDDDEETLTWQGRGR